MPFPRFVSVSFQQNTLYSVSPQTLCQAEVAAAQRWTGVHLEEAGALPSHPASLAVAVGEEAST
jgi:hypothetical protein